MALKEQILDRAQKYVLKGNLDKALGEYKAAFELDPRDISVRLKIGDLFVKSGRNAEAIKEYTEVARANAQRGFYLKAIAVYKQALKLDASNMEIHYKLAELYVKQRLIADAISAYSNILSVFEKKGKTNEVLEIVKKMVEVDPDNIGVRLKLADLYQKMSFDRDALEEYSLIFGKLLSQGKFDVAEKIYIGLYNNNPKEIVVIKGLSDLYEKKGDRREHLRFSKALFNIHRDRDDVEEAKAVCSSILEMKPDDPDALGYMARFRPAEPVEPPEEPAPPAAARPPVEEPSMPEEPSPPSGPAPVEEAPPQAGEAPAAEGQAEGPLISLPEEIEITLEGFEEGEGLGPGPEGAGGAPPLTEEAGGGLDMMEALLKPPVVGTDETGATAPTAGAEVEIELPVEIELTPEGEAPVEAAPEAVAPEKVEVEAEVPAEAVSETVAPEKIEVEAPVEVVSEAVAPEKMELEAEVPLEVTAEAVAPEKVEFEAEAPVEVVSEAVAPENMELETEVPLEVVSEAVAPEKIEVEAEVPAEAVSEAAVPEKFDFEVKAPAEVASEAAVPEKFDFEVEAPAEVASEAAVPEKFDFEVEAPAEVVLEAVVPEKVEFEAEAVVEVAPEAVAPEKVEVEAEAVVAPEAVESEKAIEEAIETAFEQTFGALAEAAAPEAPAAVEEALPSALKGDEFAGEEITEEEIESEQISSAIDDINRGLEAVVEREAGLNHEAALKDTGAAEETFASEAGAREPSPLEGLQGFAPGPMSSMASPETMIEGEPGMDRLEAPHPEVRKEEYVDLSAELGMEEALHELSGTWGEGEPEEMVTEFKKGMGEQLGREDTETHYNLGIAYMEMGLFNEASMEFKIALKDQRLEFDCYARLGLCAMHQSNPDEAIVYYLKGLKVMGRSDEERKGIMYELALAYENAGKKEESLQLFKSIYSMDGAYREVAGKVRSVMPPSAPLIPLNDGLIEVELL